MNQVIRTNKISKGLVLLLAVVTFLFGAGISYAAEADFAKNPEAQLVPCGTSTTQPCTWADFVKLANNIVNFLVFVSSMLAVLAFCYAGFLYITAGGDGGKVEQAHHIFKMVVTGMLFILCGWLLIATILKILVGDADRADIGSFIDFSGVDTLENN
ncbi:MAG: hypothetical protein WC761_05435 [Candidatus Paceibacterota bacterium]|jgi:hypothetical protein